MKDNSTEELREDFKTLTKAKYLASQYTEGGNVDRAKEIIINLLGKRVIDGNL